MTHLHVELPSDHDAQLESLRTELNAVLASLNRAYHPVRPANPVHIERLEARVAQLREAIAERRQQLREPRDG